MLIYPVLIRLKKKSTLFSFSIFSSLSASNFPSFILFVIDSLHYFGILLESIPFPPTPLTFPIFLFFHLVLFVDRLLHPVPVEPLAQHPQAVAGPCGSPPAAEDDGDVDAGEKPVLQMEDMSCACSDSLKSRIFKKSLRSN